MGFLHNDITNIGVLGKEECFGILNADRQRHVYITGQRGSGKSTLLINQVLQDIHRGYGVGFIDPHGGNADAILDYIPPARINDVVYFNPADLARPLGLNLVETVPDTYQPLIAETILSALKGIYKDSWGIQLERILRNALRVQLDNEQGTLLGVLRMLTDGRYRRTITRHVRDPVVADFWRDFETWDARERQLAVRSVLNRIEQLLSNAYLRNILARVRSTINFHTIITGRKIFIANLARSRLGDDPVYLLGSHLISKFLTASREHTNDAKEEPTPFYLSVDDFHTVAGGALNEMFSGGSDNGLCLTVASARLGQLPEETREAVLGNAGTLISFRTGSYKDAETLADAYASLRVRPETFIDLGEHEIAVKGVREYSTDGRGRELAPFEGQALPPLMSDAFDFYCGRKQTIIRQSRKRYGGRRSVIEGKIRRFMGR